jgi:hypothetical protein
MVTVGVTAKPIKRSFEPKTTLSSWQEYWGAGQCLKLSPKHYDNINFNNYCIWHIRIYYIEAT